MTDDQFPPCDTCAGSGRVSCPGPKRGCYGMHMGHRCPDCGGSGRRIVMGPAT